mgnify:CR=1 FL=1|jgi:imidazolonepropionase-like amidohydrolase
MPLSLVLRNATLFDSATGKLQPHVSVAIEGERIAWVRPAGGPDDGASRVVDLAGRTLLPGLIDAHVHVTATIPDLFRLSLLPHSLVTAQAKDILHGMLMRGFTTVRDAGGADAGLVHDLDPTAGRLVLRRGRRKEPLPGWVTRDDRASIIHPPSHASP